MRSGWRKALPHDEGSARLVQQPVHCNTLYTFAASRTAANRVDESATVELSVRHIGLTPTPTCLLQAPSSLASWPSSETKRRACASLCRIAIRLIIVTAN